MLMFDWLKRKAPLGGVSRLGFKPRASLLHAFAVFDDQVYTLQEIDVTQHIALDGNDICKLTFTDRAIVLVHFHHHSGPVGGRANSSYRVDAEVIDPCIQLVPGGAVVKFHRYAAVGADEQNHPGVL